jgi:hypothetical protein
MGLSATARSRLADIVELQPTTNGELGDRWELDDGSAVHAYLESELADHYERTDDGYIVAAAGAADAVDAEPGIERSGDGVVVRGSDLRQRIVETLPGPDERSNSVVAVLHRVREAGVDPEVDAVRNELRTLQRAGVVDTVQRSVPTYRLAVPRSSITTDG